MFAKFLASRVSGYIALAALASLAGLGAYITKQVADYKQLQVEAAYCEGQRSVNKVLEGLKDTASGIVEGSADKTIEDTKDELEATPNDCANQRAPDAILRYHGLRTPEG